MKRGLFLLFLGSGHGCLGGLGLGQTLLEFIHAACCIDEFLCAGVERMAHVANTDYNRRLRRAGFDDVPAGASNFRINVFRMYLLSHKKVVHDSQLGAVDKLDFACVAKKYRSTFFFGALHPG